MTSQNISEELQYQARQATGLPAVMPTSPDTIKRYRECQHWQWYPREFMFRAIHQLKPSHICDLGCGAGETSTELGLLGYRVIGVDLSPELIEQARTRAVADRVTDRVSFHVANVDSANLPDGKFDMVLILAVLHHMDVESGLKTAARLLKPGGTVIVQEPISLSPALRFIRRLIPISKEYSPNERQLDANDLKTIERYFNIHTCRHYFMTIRLIRLIPSRFQALQNRLSPKLHALDAWLIVRIPALYRFYGSTLMVGRKRDF